MNITEITTAEDKQIEVAEKKQLIEIIETTNEEVDIIENSSHSKDVAENSVLNREHSRTISNTGITQEGNYTIDHDQKLITEKFKPSLAKETVKKAIFEENLKMVITEVPLNNDKQEEIAESDDVKRRERRSDGTKEEKDDTDISANSGSELKYSGKPFVYTILFD